MNSPSLVQLLSQAVRGGVLAGVFVGSMLWIVALFWIGGHALLRWMARHELREK